MDTRAHQERCPSTASDGQCEDVSPCEIVSPDNKPQPNEENVGQKAGFPLRHLPEAGGLHVAGAIKSQTSIRSVADTRVT